MSTNDTGSRRASPFARGPAAASPAAPEKTEGTPEAKAAPEARTTARTAASATGVGRASPFAARSAASPETKAPEPQATAAEAPAADRTPAAPAGGSRLGSRLGTRTAEAAPSPAAPSPAASAPAKAPAPQASAGRGAGRGRAAAQPQTQAPNQRRSKAPRRDKAPLPAMPKGVPGEVDKKVNSLLLAMSQLVTVLIAENEALDRHDAGTVRSLMDSKTAKTRYYQEQMLAVHANPRLLLDLNEDQREVMRSAAKILDTVAQENGRKLKANIEATNRLMKAVVTAVNERERDKATTYSKGGAVEGDPTQAFRKAVTFNETL